MLRARLTAVLAGPVLFLASAAASYGVCALVS